MAAEADLLYQEATLEKVSRTFALTIPQLPPGLREVVGNAYLLCRLADTIEDDPGLDSAAKAGFMAEFVQVMGDDEDADDFARRLHMRLSPAMSAAEHDLVSHTATLLRVTARFTPLQRQAVARCVAIMGGGMPEFQRRVSLDGLSSLQELDRYCYYVAGVVGEMLTELFCARCPELDSRRDDMMSLAVRFGEGLQMTNILKDIWEDREANACWLPRSVFSGVSGGLGAAIRRGDTHALTEGIDALVAVAHSHLRAALEYAENIPKREVGIRRFCLWAIGMALLTLRKIHRSPGFSSGQQVKIKRRSVKLTIIACNSALVSNHLLRMLFAVAALGLPCLDDDHLETPPGAWLTQDGPR